MTLIEEIKKERNWYRKSLGIFLFHTEECLKKDNVRGVKWKIEDTARVLGLSIGYISEAIKLAKAIPKFKDSGFDKLTREKALKLIKEND